MPLPLPPRFSAVLRQLRHGWAWMRRRVRPVGGWADSPAIASSLARLLYLWACVLMAMGLAMVMSTLPRPSGRPSSPVGHVVRPWAAPSPSEPHARPTRETAGPALSTWGTGTMARFDARTLPPGVSTWGARTTPDRAYQQEQTQVERATQRWLDTVRLNNPSLLVVPTGARHEATWCQVVWEQPLGWAHADGYGATPQEACARMLREAVQRYPSVAQQAVMRGARLP